MASDGISKPDREKIAAVRRELTRAVNLIERCERCGIDVSERKAAALHQIEIFDAIQREFISGMKEVVS